jgi:hypothetical protein
MAATDPTRLSTGTPYIRDLNAQVRKGEIKVPQFQRPFVWEAAQALALLDSVANNYPIGSLLLWRTVEKLTTERSIGDFKLPDVDDLTPTEYVLDGQQRLTVLYSVLGPEPDDQGFSAVYDLVEEEFHEAKSVLPATHLFPMRWLYQTTKLLNFRTELQEHPDAAMLQQRFDSLVEVVTGYQIPVVTLRDLTIEEVCPIFERINSSGTRLSIFDLMVAATWTKTFDLNEKVTDISDSLAPKNFGDIKGTTVLKCLAAVHAKSTNRERILALRKVAPGDMTRLVNKTRKAIVNAVDQLITDFKIHSLDFLPYEAHLVILTYIYSQNPRLSAPQLRRVRQWFWRTSFEERYRGAPDTFVTSDLEAIQRFVLSGTEADASEYGNVPRDSVLSSMIFRKNNSRSRAFSLVLAKQNPKNITNGNSLDIAEALSVYNKKQFHHIFPEAFLRKLDPKIERSRTLNFAMLAASENNFVSDADPKVYLPGLIQDLGRDAKAVFASNLMPDPEDYDYEAAELDSFIEARLPLVRTAIEELCRGGA